MNRIIATCAALILAASATSAVAQQRGNRALASVIAAHEEIARRYDPLTSASEGDREALQRLPDVSRETELAQRAELRRYERRWSGRPRAGSTAKMR
jgi:hypothetical protein